MTHTFQGMGCLFDSWLYWEADRLCCLVARQEDQKFSRRRNNPAK